MKRKGKITVTFEPKFRFGDIVYCVFSNAVRKVMVEQVFFGCNYDTYGSGKCDTYIEYRVYDEERLCKYVISEYKIFATKEEAENYLY